VAIAPFGSCAAVRLFRREKMVLYSSQRDARPAKGTNEPQ